MDWATFFTALGGMIAAMGGWEGVKRIIQAISNYRNASAKRKRVMDTHRSSTARQDAEYEAQVRRDNFEYFEKRYQDHLNQQQDKYTKMETGYHNRIIEIETDYRDRIKELEQDYEKRLEESEKKCNERLSHLEGKTCVLEDKCSELQNELSSLKIKYMEANLRLVKHENEIKNNTAS